MVTLRGAALRCGQHGWGADGLPGGGHGCRDGRDGLFGGGDSWRDVRDGLSGGDDGWRDRSVALRRGALSLQGIPRGGGWRGRGHNAVAHQGRWLPCNTGRAEQMITQRGQPRPPKHSPGEQGCPWPQGLRTVPRSPQERQRDPHPSPPAVPVSGGAHAAPRWVPGAGCTMHSGTGRGSARHRRHKAVLLPPTAATPAPPRGDAGTETPRRHRDPRASPSLSPEDAGLLPPALAAEPEAGWARAPRPDVTAPAHVPQRRAMPRPGPRTAMNSWPRNAHEAAAGKQPPPCVGPGHSLPRRGAGRGACCLLCVPRREQLGESPPIPASPRGAGDPGGARCTPRCRGWSDGASHPAKPQHTPSAKVDVPGLPAVTSSGDSPQPSPG